MSEKQQSLVLKATERSGMIRPCGNRTAYVESLSLESDRMISGSIRLTKRLHRNQQGDEGRMGWLIPPLRLLSVRNAFQPALDRVIRYR
jgi:hypothetical protein